jgi:hypothetical protein
LPSAGKYDTIGLSGRRKACAAGWANRKEAGKPAGRGETVLKVVEKPKLRQAMLSCRFFKPDIKNNKNNYRFIRKQKGGAIT